MLISELARLSGMSKDGIRHYEEMGLIASSARQAGSRSYRDYDPAVLQTIEQVRQAQMLGFSLKEIAPLLKAYGSANFTPEQTVSFLEERLVVIRKRQAALNEVEGFILQKLDRYRSAMAESADARAKESAGAAGMP